MELYFTVQVKYDRNYKNVFLPFKQVIHLRSCLNQLAQLLRHQFLDLRKKIEDSENEKKGSGEEYK